MSSIKKLMCFSKTFCNYSICIHLQVLGKKCWNLLANPSILETYRVPIRSAQRFCCVVDTESLWLLTPLILKVGSYAYRLCRDTTNNCFTKTLRIISMESHHSAYCWYGESRVPHTFNPNQNDQGRKGPCCFQRPNALKCQKIKKYLIFL